MESQRGRQQESSCAKHSPGDTGHSLGQSARLGKLKELAIGRRREVGLHALSPIGCDIPRILTAKGAGIVMFLEVHGESVLMHTFD